MKASVVALCLLALIGSTVPTQAQAIQIGDLEISDDLFEIDEMRAPAEGALEREAVQAQGQQESWMARNWKWFGPVVLVVGVGAALAGGAAGGGGY